MADVISHIDCPACNERMEKVFMPEAGVNVDICLNGCGGLFFDNRELEKFDELHENADKIIEAVKGKTFKAVNEDEVRICPCCGHPMTKMGAANGAVQIDVCNTCGGKFLDHGELEKIREYQDQDDSAVDELMNSIYRENLHEVLGNNANRAIKSSPRRQFFENLIKNYL